MCACSATSRASAKKCTLMSASHAYTCASVFCACMPSPQKVHVYEAASWSGSPEETEEMKPRWFDITQMPSEMWADDSYWFPLFTSGVSFKGQFTYADDDTIVDYTLQQVEAFSRSD